MLAEPGYHTRAFVEWEGWPRFVLIAAQRAGYFEPAPIWDDLRSFDARVFRGAFDIVLAGYPCQPFSAAGKRGGADDPRHLWPEVARVAAAAEPALRRMADGLAHRARALRLLGNGVHPLAAAHAWRALAAAHGLGPVDLAADGTGPAPDTDVPV